MLAVVLKQMKTMLLVQCWFSSILEREIENSMAWKYYRSIHEQQTNIQSVVICAVCCSFSFSFSLFHMYFVLLLLFIYFSCTKERTMYQAYAEQSFFIACLNSCSCARELKLTHTFETNFKILTERKEKKNKKFPDVILILSAFIF